MNDDDNAPDFKQPDVATNSEQVAEPPQPSPEPNEPIEPTPLPTTEPSGFKKKLAQFKSYYGSHKKLAIPATVVLVIGLLLAVPVTRYALLGTFIKKDFTATVLDSKTNQPVSSVKLTLDGKTAETDQSGMAKFTGVKVGNHTLTATKKYYTDTETDVLVPVMGGSQSAEVKLTATGRQVKVSVTNKLNGKGVQSALVSAADTEAKTDEKGEATIVLPADKDSQDAEITADGYNKQTAKISVSEGDISDQNKFTVTPSGKIYFLSKRTGKINVMKSDLDGSNAVVVLEATGNEEDTDTILLASQDWKYLALKSRRNSADKPASLYLIDTSNDKLTNMDEGDATFTMVGWSGHNFVYQVQRDKVGFHQPNKYSLKSYNAEASKITVLDNTAGEGTGASSYYGSDYKSEYYGQTILLDGQVNYTKTWVAGTYTADGSYLAGKNSGIYTVGVDGQGKKTLKSFEASKTSSIESKLYEPKEIYYRVYTNGGQEYYEYHNGSISTKGDLSATFNGVYPTFLISPNNTQTFWAESRDGKNTLFIGNAEGEDSKPVAELSEYAAYGWFTNDYILLSKNSSELYVVGAAEIKDSNIPVKVTDYHKPNTVFYGYGGGYGGL